jgi:flagellar biosynthesis protein FlhF
MARRYGDLAPERLIFSKLDEADGPGSVLSATAALARPISCITDGQRVPEDIHAVSAQDLQKLVFVN